MHCKQNATPSCMNKVVLSNSDRVMNFETVPINPSIQPSGVVRSYRRRSEIVREEDPADHLYVVVSGTVCTCKMIREGRRQVAGFYFAGDVFGLESSKKH